MYKRVHCSAQVQISTIPTSMHTQACTLQDSVVTAVLVLADAQQSPAQQQPCVRYKLVHISCK
jgi:hypothetical protein